MSHKSCFAFFWLMLLVTAASAQTINNQWIQFDQRYFRVAVQQDGIYRISYEQLLEAGVPAGAVDPRDIQLFARGQEVAITVAGQEDGVFNTGDYIEFYGERNTGETDTDMYRLPEIQSNPYVSMYTGQRIYFLTWSLDGTRGKRMASQNFGQQPAQTLPWHLKKEVQPFSNQFINGPLYPRFFQSITDQGALLSDFEQESKGFTHLARGGNTKADFPVNIRGYVASGPLPRMEINISGRSNTVHNVDVVAGPATGGQQRIGNLQFNFYNNARLQHTFSSGQVPADGEFLVSYQINQVSPNVNEIVSASYLWLEYPQRPSAFNEPQAVFNFPASGSNFIRAQIAEVPEGAVWYDISDPASIARVEATTSNGTATITLQGRGTGSKLLMVTQTREVDSMEPASISPLNAAQKNYLLVSHTSLMQPAAGYGDPVLAYAEYRESAQGGGHKVLLADVENLYNQFTWGEPTPLAIRRFIKWAQAQTNPEFLFLLGKGLAYFWYYEYNKPGSLNWTYQNLVPCYGEPCSDNALSMEARPFHQAPQLATGRVSAISPEQVAFYLNKVKEFESGRQATDWKKRMMHLTGGKTQEENNLLSGHLASIAPLPQAAPLGARLTAIAKKTTEEVEFIDVTEEVNAGVSLITFFGHSSLRATDFEIGNVSSEILGYRNKGKYPFLFMMGCDAGHAFARTRSFGEDWVLTPDKGAIGFLGHSHLGFINAQKQLAEVFYQTLFEDSTNLSMPIGKVLQQTYDRYLSPRPYDGLSIANVQQFTLSCDPAVKIFNLKQPDYSLTEQQLQVLSFDPAEPVSLDSDSLRLRIVAENLGLVHSGEVIIRVQRQFEEGTLRQYQALSIPAVAFRDTVYFTIPVPEEDRALSGGTSEITVTLDAPNQIAEEDETNNTASIRLVLPKTSLTLLSPREFAIASQPATELIAQDARRNNSKQPYQFQLDTSVLFNSPVLRDTLVNAEGLPAWPLALPEAMPGDSTVYFWRAKHISEEENEWVGSSFIYLPQSPEGWSQSVAPQFRRNRFDNLSISEITGQWEFPSDTVKIQARSAGRFAPDLNAFGITYDGIPAIRPGECGYNAILAVAFDHVTGQPYLPTPDFWNYCGFGNPGLAVRIPEANIRTDNRIKWYLDQVKENDFVVLISTGRVNFNLFSNEVIAAFGLIGCDPENLRQLSRDEPYIAFGQKGAAPGTATEVLPRYTAAEAPRTQMISGGFFFVKQTRLGKVTTPRIGPGSAWQSVWLDLKERQSDDLQVNLYGVRLRGGEELLQEDLPDGLSDISFVDAASFPYLRLEAVFTRPASGNLANLRNWKVLFAEVPEGIIARSPRAADDFEGLLTEGDTARFTWSYRNVSATGFTSPLVAEYNLQNLQSGSEQVFYDTLSALPAGDSLVLAQGVPTRGLAGQNRLSVYVNPRLQAEQVFENNISETGFEVQADTVHPVLEVVFDGRRIMDGEIVAPEPLITINVRDENPFLLRQDTVGLNVFLSACDSCDFRRVPFASQQMSWAQQGDNQFQVYYQPERLVDGVYALRVQAEDVSGNQSGTQPYQVRFEVVNESSVTHFYPYPNPFSDRVQFVFTLTGSDLPDDMKIQIMTVSGRVVREITRQELGPIRIGHNITDYAWDGRDEFGDQLANGVYLYRVVMSGLQAEHRLTAGDDLFSNGFGKMYLMR